MVAAFDYCLHGKGGAAPSIDTAMHGLVDAAARRPPAPRLRHRARHRRRRRGADQGVLRRPGACGCRGAGPASSSAWTSPRSSAANPQAIGVILGGHGITAWGATSERVRGATRWRSSGPRRRYLAERGRRRAVRRRSVAGYEPLPEAERRARAAALAPVIRGLASTDRPQVGHFTDSRRGAGLPGPREAPARWPRSAPPARTTSCAPRSGRWCSTCPPTPRSRRSVARLRGAARGLPRRTTPPTTSATPTPDSPGDARRRPGDRAGARRRACSPSARTSRPPGWPASSTSTRST